MATMHNEKGESKKEDSFFLQGLSQVVSENGDRTFATWHNDEGKATKEYSFQELWNEAGLIAYHLRLKWNLNKGDLVVLCYNFGLHFFASLLGCLRAGVVAVLVYPPGPPLVKSLQKMAGVVSDCSPRLILTDSDVSKLRQADKVNPMSKSRLMWPKIQWKTTDKLMQANIRQSKSLLGRKLLGGGGSWKSQDSKADAVPAFDEPSAKPSDLAFLQYTSGSTGNPKGVMVTFSALKANVALVNNGILKSFVDDGGLPSEIIGFSWLPQYHDLGLIYAGISPFVCGWRMHMISPISFIKNPLIWLELMSKYGVSWSVSPDFGIQYLRRKFNEAREKDGGDCPIAELDLGALRHIAVGAEPVRPTTPSALDMLHEHGLRQDWFYTGYGLAENVVGVCWIHNATTPQDPSKGSFIACGHRKNFDESLSVKIVSEATLDELPDGETGEIWLGGPSKAAGYFGKPDLSKEVFQAKLRAVETETFLRTGDLGFFEDGYLYICGRIKDLIIFQGVNHYPQDIELAAQESSAAVRPGCVAAFSSNETSMDGVVELVFEIRKESTNNALDVCSEIHEAVSIATGLDISRIVAIKPKCIPKTTSGKIRRRATRSALHDGLFKKCIIAKWTKDVVSNGILKRPSNDKSDSSMKARDGVNQQVGGCPSKGWSLDSIRAVIHEEVDRLAGIGVKKGGTPLPPELLDTLSSSSVSRIELFLSDVAGAKEATGVEVGPRQKKSHGSTKQWSLAEIEEKVEAAVRNVITVNSDAPIDCQACLMDLGLDSLGSTELTSMLESVFSVTLPATFVFNAPTINAIVDHLSYMLVPDTEVTEPMKQRGLGSEKLSAKLEFAIVGMSCSFPGGASSPRQYWSLLQDGKDTSSCIPFERWDAFGLAANSDLTGRGKAQVLYGSFVDDIELFDPSVFGISKAEAEAMSPLQRTLLECSYLAFLDAGYSRGDMTGLNCGVYVGASATSLGRPSSVFGNDKDLSVYSAIGSSASIASGRISYTFNFQGPNSVYDTACSSSLVALDAAVSALKEGKCDMALVAGGSELFDRSVFNACARAGMLSPTGRCHTFDASADGYLRGEGCGAILLVPSNAAKPGSIYANVIGTSIMSGGKSASITTPNGAVQARSLNKALEVSGVEPRDVDYIEAHGTGTALGDPIEVEALAEVFADSRAETSPLMVGSVKANIGHLECAAGIAGLIKAALVLGHSSVPPNSALETLNPLIEKTIEMHDFHIDFPTSVKPLANDSNDNKLLVAGVSSFGYSGTVAHAILRQAPPDMQRSIDDEDSGAIEQDSSKFVEISPLFLFTGQGSQYVRMGQHLYNENEAFRKAMDQCEDIYTHLAKGQSLLDIMFNDEVALMRTSQPALVALEWSLATMWRSCGVSPGLVLGHSVGEIAAACVAGAMSIETALELAFVRARLVNDLPSNNGVMAAVRCSMDEAKRAVASFSPDEQTLIGVGSENGPKSIVLSGAESVVDKVLAKLGKRGVSLTVSHAFHSPLMKGMKDKFRHVVASLDTQQPLTIPVASTVTGQILGVGNVIDVEHWVDQLTSPVLFLDAFEEAMEDNTIPNVVIEVGPGPVLTNLGKSIRASSSDTDELMWIASLAKGQSAPKFENSLESMKEFLDKRRPLLAPRDVHTLTFPNRMHLPWPKSPPHPLLQGGLPIGSQGNEYRTIFHDKLMELYSGHVVAGRTIFPGSGYIEMGVAACAASSPRGISGGVELSDVRFVRPFDVEAGCELVCNYLYLEGHVEFLDLTKEKTSSVVASISEININIGCESHGTLNESSLDALRQSHVRAVSGIQDRYAQLAEAGFHRGAFQSIQRVSMGEEGKSVLARVGLPENHQHEHDLHYHVHPAVLDGVFQLIGYLLSESDQTIACDAAWVPAGISSVVLHGDSRDLCKPGVAVWAHVALVCDSSTLKTCKMEVFDERGCLLLSIDGFRYSKLGCSVSSESQASLFVAEWVESPPDTHDGAVSVAVDLDDTAVVQLSGCLPFSGSSVISLREVEELDTESLPAAFIVPVVSLNSHIHADDSSLIEECVLLIKALTIKLQSASTTRKNTHCICFWTRSGEDPGRRPGMLGVDEESEGRVHTDVILSLIGSSIQGMARSAALEVESSRVQIICVDTDSGCYKNERCLDKVISELGRSDKIETLVSYREGSRYVHRLKPSSHPIIEDVALTLNKRGSLENLQVADLKGPVSASVPADCVEVSVYSVGLNFKDVLNVLVPDEAAYVGCGLPPLPGSDFAGVVTRTGASHAGSRSSQFAVGDRVYGLSFDMLRSNKLVPTNLIAKMPGNLSFEEASALPMVFLTVLYALRDQAKLKRGDRILIHSAAGGVGLAAVQYAQFVGAEIFATASPSKHEYLHSIGVANLSTSRDEAVFEDEMGKLVGEVGVDVVLSAGNLVEKSLDMLAGGGRFLELGKRNIITPEDMSTRRPDVEYITHTLNEEGYYDPEKVGSMLNEVSGYIESGVFSPPKHETFEFQSGLIQAFKKLRDGQNVGKVVVRLKKEPNVGTAVITGGLGGLGLVAVEVLSDIGAANIVLVSRSGKVKSYAGQNLEDRLDRLLQLDSGSLVSIECCDMSDEEEVKSLLARVREKHGSIDTIVHASGVLKDGMLQNMTAEAVRTPFKPKAAGAWYLHKHTGSDELEHFVLFSSIAALFGNFGQANYSASNSYLDALVRLRHSMGMPAVSIQWPAVADVGMAAANAEVMKLSMKQQLPLTSVKKVLRHTFLASCVNDEGVFTPLPSALLDTLSSSTSSRIASFLSDVVGVNGATGVEVGSRRKKSQGATKQWSLAEIEKEVEAAVRSVVACDDSPMSHQVSVLDMGLDSLGATELPDVLTSRFKVDLDATFVLNHPSIADMTKHLHGLLSSHSLEQEEEKKAEVNEMVLRQNRADYSILPKACQDTLHSLITFVDNLDLDDLMPAVDVPKVRTVFLTGATGFFGRHFLADLLNSSNSIETIYCIVRAPDDQTAMRRIIKAMMEAGVWSEQFQNKIIALAGDMQFDLFGISLQQFNKLSKEVDSIYHFSSSLVLCAPYDVMYKRNSLTLKAVLRLCLTFKKKHLFYTGTLGIFPQYMCGFANEWTGVPIADFSLPNYLDMKSYFPLEICGYNWSKLVNELVLMHVRDNFQLPLAIFRLPLMATNIQTGYLVADDPSVRSLQGFLQTGQRTKLAPLVAEDAGTCIEILLKISQNPHRKYSIYNTSRQTHRVPTHMSWMDAVGYNTKQVSYKEFRTASKEFEDSPVATYWPLFDMFSSWWFENVNADAQYPIETKAIETDCHHLPPKPNPLKLLEESRAWAMRNEDIWPFDLAYFKINLTMDAVLAGPKDICNKYGLDFDACVPAHVMEGLQRIVNEIDAPNTSMPKIIFNITSKLESRINLYHIYKAYPEIADEEIKAPIFILGLNRTGTTFLHRMLDASGCVSCPKVEENGCFPTMEDLFSPSLEKDRLGFIGSVLDETFSSLQGIHEMGIGIAEEDFSAHSLAFHSLEYDVNYGLPQYREWLDAQSFNEVYMEHRRWLKFLSWWRKHQGKPAVQRWCLKFPWHARSIGALLNEYPDARIIHTHRSFIDVIASWCSLVESQRKRFYDDVDKKGIGREQLKSFVLTLKRAAEFRHSNPSVEKQWLDIDFRDIVSSPLKVAQKVLRHAGITPNQAAIERTDGYIKDITSERKTKNSHKYDIGDYGISPHDCNHVLL